MHGTAPTNVRRIDSLPAANCREAARQATDLLAKVKEFERLGCRPVFAGRTFPYAEMRSQIETLIHLVENQESRCALRGDHGERSCVETLCPLSTAPMEVACLGVSIAALRLEASALHLCHVAH